MSDDSTDHEATTRRLERLSWLLDSAVRLPGGFRVGVDGIIGLVPGIGDLVGAGLSSYIILEAARMKLPAGVLARMGLNVLLELGIGIIPIFGDLFDFAFKANRRNVSLLNEYLAKKQERSER